jgi:hypothetical protein
MIDTMERCVTCNQDSMRYAYLGREGYECENCYDECTELAPESITFYSARFSGTGVAECKNCNFKSVYWECACDLFHDCNDN